MGKVTIRKEWKVRRGKDGSMKRFGPYRVDYWRESGKLKKRYMGLWVPEYEAPEALKHKVLELDYADELLAGRPVPDWWCCDLLGIVAGDSFSVRREKYRAAVRPLGKPDSGPLKRAYLLLRAAWDQVRKGRR